MSESSIENAPTTGAPRWLSLLVIGLSGLFYAYAVWNAVAHLIAMAKEGLTGMGWATLGFGVVFPALVFVLALAVGRRRHAGELSLVMLTGLGVIAVFWLSLIGYSVLNMDSLVAG